MALPGWPNWAPYCFLESAMSEPGFSVETTLPLLWQPGILTPAQRHGSLLLLRVVNLLDGHDAEQERGQERVEARLDLMLHWLGMQLFGERAVPAPLPVRLEVGRIEWPADAAPAAGEAILDLYIHPAMAAPLKLPARVAHFQSGRVAAEVILGSGELSDAWTQWLFRRHRRAVHEARTRTGQA